MKKLILSLTLAGGLIGLSACSADTASSDVVAETSAGDITKDELYNAMKEQYGEQTLQKLVYDKVLAEKYEVDTKELDNKVQEIKDQSGANFEMILMQNNIKDENALRKMLKSQLLIEKAAIKEIEVTEDELKESYENYKPEIKARHILVEDEETAKEVKQKLESGDEFEKLAKEYSKDPGSAEEGGDLGWFGSGKMVPEFEDAAYSLEVNEISEPVKSQNGFHIIQVTEKKQKESFDKMKKELEYQLKVSKIDNTKVLEVMEKEVKDAEVEIKDKDLEGIFETTSTQK
ncbi:peptidylprolyl isomerase [Mesobacillus maritimus]|uniref:peptidylprolyl isomerase n=1 Tax=Mesobacillus maritimus TaxID=1643336 RepID=UPI0020408F75|nr:peptidylprolyl isomerase [Mesobacillus maritimus]MCM3668991.1 peptidylprolyl isomerase [Mesobacillus maritimus]